MSCVDVMYPAAHGHYAPYAPAAPAFINSLQAPVGLRSPSHHCRSLMDIAVSERGGPLDGPSGPGSSSSSSSSSYPSLAAAGASTSRGEDGGGGGGAKEKQEAAVEAEYLTSRCVLFTYYHGDISSVVDEHFSRALSSYMEGEGKRRAAADMGTDPLSPSSRRSFPPSFWDSNYPPQSRPHCDPGAPTYSMEPYASGLHPGLPHPHPHPHHHAHAHPHPHPAEGWGYAQSQAYGPPHRPLHELYSPSGLEPHYGPLLMSAVRPPHLGGLPGHYEVGKLEPGSAWPGLLPPGDVGQTLALNMDAGLQHHKKGKELYWF